MSKKNKQKDIEERAEMEEGASAEAEEELPFSGEKNEDGQENNESTTSEENEMSEELLNKKLTDMNDRYIRLMAEFDNFKRRTSREYERMVESANERLMVSLLPVRDNFERALKAKDTNASLEALHQGMEMIYSKLDETLKNSGLEPFGEKGDEFDPQIHDALMNSPSEDIPEGHVADLFERGYKLKGKVIRHAKVIVSSGKPEESDEEESDEKE